jgi:hypothetical protein
MCANGKNETILSMGGGEDKGEWGRRSNQV